MKFVLTGILICFGLLLQAQEVEMADQMRSEGKIYVVVAVLTVILLGLFFYLIRIDRKLSKLEKENQKSS